MKKIIILILIFTYSYAVIRYHVGENIPWSEFLFVVNKAFSWSAFILISWSILPKKWFLKRNLQRKYFGITGYIFALIHVILNIFLININRFPQFYSSNKNWTNEFYLFASIGLISFLIFSLIFLVSTNLVKTKNKDKIISLGLYTIVFCALHPFLIGYKNWLNINSWPLFLPPITLLSILILILFLIIKRIERH
jgi:DMSO/TMAO reductase YedYZ heme-binding membrane subunit